MTKHVTLFGRKMRKYSDRCFRLGECEVRTGQFSGQWQGWCRDTGWTDLFRSPHAAARALERKIVAAHRGLGKLMGKERA